MQKIVGKEYSPFTVEVEKRWIRSFAEAIGDDDPVYRDEQAITGRQKVVDLYDKKGGALTFIVTETTLDNQRGERVCELTTTIVVRNGSSGREASR